MHTHSEYIFFAWNDNSKYSWVSMYYTVRSNQNGWKATLWSKVRVFWHCINCFKSAANHFFTILCCRKNIDLSNEVLSILVSKGVDKLPDVKVWDLMNDLLRAHSNPNLLNKRVFECACKRFFIKPQTLTFGSLSALWDTRMLNASFERSIFFLQHKILKEWIVALFRWFMLCQTSLILLHKMAFQPYWLDVTV